MSVRDNIESGVYNNMLPWAKTGEAREAYRAEDRRIREKFRADLENEYGIREALGSLRITQAKADRLWSLAWDHGHSGGLNEVVGFYEDFVDLVL